MGPVAKQRSIAGLGSLLIALLVATGRLDVVVVAAVAVAIYLLKHLRTTLAILSPRKSFLSIFILYNGLGLAVSQSQHKLEILGLLFLGATGFLLGTILGARKLKPSISVTPISLSVGMLRCSTALGTGMMLYLFARHGVPVFSPNPNLARLTFFDNGYVSTLSIVALYTSFTVAGCRIFAAGEFSRASSETLTSTEATVHFAMAMLLLATTGNRGQLVTPLVTTVLFVVVVRRSRLRPIVTSAAALICVVALTGYARYRAAFGPTYDEDLALAGFRGNVKYFGNMLEYLGGTIDTLDRTLQTFPSRIPYRLGAEFFGPLLHKPSADLYLKSVFGYHFQGFGIALGATNALYLDFSWIGVLVGFILTGILIERLYHDAVARRGATLLIYCYAVQWMWISNYGHPFAYLSTALYPACLWVILRGRPSPAPLLRHSTSGAYD